MPSRSCVRNESIVLPYAGTIWAIWGSYCNIPKVMFYLRKEDCNVLRTIGMLRQ